MPSRFQPIQAGTDPSQQLAMINKNFAELDNENVKKLFYDSNGTPSILIGVQQDGTSAIKVSKAGIDVTTATNDQLAFNSSQDQLKVVKSGSYTVGSNYTSTNPGAGLFGTDSFVVGTIAHGLSFVPAVLAYVNVGATDYYQMPQTTMAGFGTKAFWNVWSASTDATNLYFYLRVMSYGGGQLVVAGTQIKYYLLQETAV